MFEKVIRDNVHGDIIFKEPIFIEIINTPEFQRLRRILQLGGAGFAYLGATHTRFAHSIGTYHIINLFVESQGFQKHVNEKEKLLVKLAGLMHDLGHGAFSHTFEKITIKKHEDYTIDIISNPNGNIYPILKKYKINPKDVCSIINGSYKNKFINSLVSSQLDGDRLDYLMRDSYNCGVDYVSLDISWIVRHVEIKDKKIIYPIKTIHAIESYLLGRYHMYKQVYNHKTSISFDVMFTTWYKRLKDLKHLGFEFKNKRIDYLFNEVFINKDIPIEKYLKFDDYTMIDIFKSTIHENDKILSDLSDRLVNRRLFSVKKSTEINIKEIKNTLKEKGYNEKYYFQEFESKPVKIYEDSSKSEKDETIWIYNGKVIKPLSKVSLFGESMKQDNIKNIEKKYLFPKDIGISF